MIESMNFETATSGSLARVLSGFRVNADPFSVLAKLFKLDNSIDLGKKGVIPAATDVGAWVNFCAELSYDNIARLDELTTKSFYASALSGAVTSVS